jgi:hypothetical protein
MVNALKVALPDSIWASEDALKNLSAFGNAGGPYGSDCGALLAGILMMTLVGAPNDLKLELYKWYCDTPFPSTEWDSLYPISDTIQSVAGSPLCHISRAIWEGTFIREVYPVTGVYDTTRCGKMPRDVTKKIVELINAWKFDGYLGSWAPDANYKKCFDCHTDLYANKLPGGIHSGKFDCTDCHDMPGSHGRVKGPK